MSRSGDPTTCPIVRNLARLHDIPADSLTAIVASYNHAADTLPYKDEVLSLAAALGAMRVGSAWRRLSSPRCAA